VFNKAGVVVGVVVVSVTALVVMVGITACAPSPAQSPTAVVSTVAASVSTTAVPLTGTSSFDATSDVTDAPESTIPIPGLEAYSTAMTAWTRKDTGASSVISFTAPGTPATTSTTAPGAPDTTTPTAPGGQGGSGQSGRLEGNGLVLEWQITGAVVGEMSFADRTWQATGTLTSTTVRFSGKMSATVPDSTWTNSGMTAYISLPFGQNTKTVEWKGELSQEAGLMHELPFDLTLEVPPGTRIQMAASVNKVGDVASDLLGIYVGLDPPAPAGTQ
jgi:hypothetical protein